MPSIRFRQDISLFGKYRLVRADFTGGNLDLFSAIGVAIPLGYEPNGILSIGNGAFNTNLHLGAQLNTDIGLFVSAIGGYSLRGEADDEFGVNGGDEFDVPNAFLFTGKVGYATSFLYVDAYLNLQSSADGLDISDMNFGGRFPEAEVNFTVVGLNVYVPVGSVVGLSAGYGTVVDGRNVGESDIFSAAVTFNINTAAE